MKSYIHWMHIGLTFFIAANLTLSTSARSEQLIVGVNAPNLGWAPESQSQEVLKKIASNSVKAVRLTFRPPYEKDIAIMTMAKALGLNIVLTISVNSKDYYSPGAFNQDGTHRLSEIDIDRFEQNLSQAWKKIEAQKISIIAVEIGNEINWAKFNGDLQAASTTEGNVYADVSSLPEASEFNRGLDKYVELVRFVKKLRDSSVINRKMIIMPAGLARISPLHAEQRQADGVSAAAMLQSLHDRGIDNLVDAHSIHYYPNVRAGATERAENAEKTVEECHTGDPQKPCWMTEWGVSNTDSACPIDDSARKEIIVETRHALARSVADGRLSALFYFEWNGKTPRSIWRCGALTDAGHAALIPFVEEPNLSH